MEERKTLAWRYYEQGRSYNLGLRPSLYTVVNTNIEFFTGNQWLGLPQTRAMAALPADCREILSLREIGGLSYEELAQTLHLELGTVRSRLNRARKKLCDELMKSGNFSDAPAVKKREGGARR